MENKNIINTINYMIKLSDNVDKNIEDLMKKLGFDTKAEVFTNALAYYLWIIEETEKGNKVISIKEGIISQTIESRIVLPKIYKQEIEK